MIWVIAGVLASGAAVSASEPPTRAGLQRLVPLGLDLYMPVPEKNPLSADKIALGRRLFAEHLLSRDRRLSCAGCHNLGRAFMDGKPVAVGVFGRKGIRNVPTLINRGYGVSFFWDGRASSLEKQVL
jgi:cytochrome c peroxidase